MFPVPPYLHTRNNQIMEVTKTLASSIFFAHTGDKGTKACEQRLSSVHHVWTMHRGILGIHIFSTYLYYLHAYLIPLDCGVLKPCVSLNFFFSFNIIINSKRGGALKAGVLIVWYSHVVQALGNVGPRKPGSTKPKALG